MRKISFVLLLFVMIFAASVVSFAKEVEAEYSLKYIHGEYVLSREDAELMREGSILPILSELDGASVVCDNVRIFEDISVEESSLILSGSIFMDSGATIAVNKGGELWLSNLDLRINDTESGIEVEEGTLRLDSARILGIARSAVTVGSENSVLEILNGTEIESGIYDITTSATIRFAADFGEEYTGSDEFKVRYTGDGEALADIVKIESSLEPPVKIYSEDGEEIKIFAISYINELTNDFSEYRLQNESFTPPEGEAVEGYYFYGWSLGASSVSGSISCLSPLTLYSEYKLSPPEFSLSGLDITYDGEYHTVAPSKITHPLLEYGDLTFRWYKDGKLISNGRGMEFRNTADSGLYTLVAEFSYKEDVSVARMENIRVEIAPITLKAEFENGSFTLVSGALLNGETVNVSTVEKDGKLYAVSDNSNYCLDFSPVIYESKSSVVSIVAWCMVLLTILSAVAFIVFCSAERDADIAASRGGIGEFSKDAFVAMAKGDAEMRERFFGIDALKADELLSDRLAKNMIRRGEFVMTEGSGISTVSLGEINSAFKAGERADICEMKRRGLISNEMLKVRITPEGILDKPIKILANEFDISAVKMISLSGGEAIKVKSRRKI